MLWILAAAAILILIGATTLGAKQDFHFDRAVLRSLVLRWALQRERVHGGQAVSYSRGLDPALVWGVIMVESSGNPRAQNPADPSTGLMQVTPLIGRFYGGLEGDDSQVLAQLIEPNSNLRAGTGFLLDLQRKYAHRFLLSEWVQAYNLGEPQFDRGIRNQQYGNKVQEAMRQWDA